jgi:ADP-ribosylglycohydrolase
MRVAPVGLIYPGQLDVACAQALVTCLPSHDADVAISAACSVTAAVSQALIEDELEPVIEASLKGARIGEELARRHARVVAGPSYLGRLELALQIAREAKDDRTFMTTMERLVGNSVLASESVPAALGIVLYAQGDPMRTIALGASIGNDTDSIATMAGAIVGALRGAKNLPRDLLEEFREANAAEFDLDTIAAGLAAIASRNLARTRP